MSVRRPCPELAVRHVAAPHGTLSNLGGLPGVSPTMPLALAHPALPALLRVAAARPARPTRRTRPSHAARAARQARLARVALWALAAGALGAPGASGAQEPGATRPDPDAECYGFSFGAWHPALNWRAAGHPPSMEPAALAGARAGRTPGAPAAGRPVRPGTTPPPNQSRPPEWAVREPARGAEDRERPGPPATVGGADSAESAGDPRAEVALTLFPSWWPVGVSVHLPRRPEVGDTIAGRATALVADGRVTPPASTIRAWRVVCARQ